MGANLCISLRHSSNQDEPTRARSSINGGKSSSGSSLIMALIKLNCWKNTENMKRKVEFDDIIAQDQKMMRPLTLEHCLLASPGSKPFINHMSSIKVHPSSSSSGVFMAGLLSTERESFCGERLMEKVHEVGEEKTSEISSILRKSQSGKLKKKVSFKLPEETDIVIFYSPDEEDCTN